MENSAKSPFAATRHKTPQFNAIATPTKQAVFNKPKSAISHSTVDVLRGAIEEYDGMDRWRYQE
jgi:hypothetical protein